MAAAASEPAFVTTPAMSAASEAHATVMPKAVAANPGTGATDRSPLVVRASAPSWIEVLDASGQVLLSRNLLAGESAGIDGAMPLRVTIGNAGATQMEFRGRPVDLAPNTRDNVARIQLN
jgi:cytoskeleton protein RodZ